MSAPVFTQTLAVAGVILEKDGKILLAQEARGLDKGKWNHPAGLIDVGEDPVTAARREVLEETGYHFEPTRLLGVYSFMRKYKDPSISVTPHAIKLIYTGRILNDGRQKLEADIATTEWFTPEEIYAMDSTTLRDEDIKQMIRDYLSGKAIGLDALTHTEWEV